MTNRAPKEGATQDTCRMSATDQNPAIALSPQEAWRLLSKAVVGRVAVVFDGRPEIFPVNHLVDDGSVVFRTSAGTGLAGAGGHWVAFEVDGYDEDTTSAWSVLVKGRAEVMKGVDDLPGVVERPPFPWNVSPAPHVIRIEPDSITGRRFNVAAEARVRGMPNQRRRTPED